MMTSPRSPYAHLRDFPHSMGSFTRACRAHGQEKTRRHQRSFMAISMNSTIERKRDGERTIPRPSEWDARMNSCDSESTTVGSSGPQSDRLCLSSASLELVCLCVCIAPVCLSPVTVQVTVAAREFVARLKGKDTAIRRKFTKNPIEQAVGVSANVCVASSCFPLVFSSSPLLCWG